MTDALFGEEDVIFSYSRSDALRDGVLVDVSEMAREAGVKVPVAVTARVWADVVTPPEEAKGRGQSAEGRLWDVLRMFTIGARAATGKAILTYSVLVDDGAGPQERVLKAVIGPGDTPDPVITIMFPEED